MTQRNSLDTLPNELILKIADYVDPEQQDPKQLLPWMYTSKNYYTLLRPMLYKSIYCFITFDDTEAVEQKLQETKDGLCFNEQTLITKSHSFIKLMVLLEERPDLLELIQHFNFQCLNFKVEDKFVSDNLQRCLNTEELNNGEFLNKKPINFYKASSGVDSMTFHIFKSFINTLQTHKSLSGSDNSKKLELENALISNDEKTQIAITESLRRVLFCPFDFKYFESPSHYSLIESVMSMVRLARSLRKENKDVHCSIMNLQNVMVQSSFNHMYEEDQDCLMKLNVMHYFA